MFFPSLALLFTIVVVLLLSRLTSRMLLQLLGEKVYIFFLWPGVIVHEGSHLLGAFLTLTPVRGFSIMPAQGGSRSRVLGFVRHDKPKNLFASIIVSGFPLVGGIVFFWLLTHILLPEFSTVVRGLDVRAGVDGLVEFLSLLWKGMTQLTLHNGWRAWLFLYLSFAVSAHLAPSNHDLKYVIKAFIGLALLFSIIYILGNSFQTSFVDNFFAWLTTYLNNGITKILFIFFYPTIILTVAAFISTLLYLLKKAVRGY